MKPVDIAVVGHFSLDHIILPTSKSPYSVLGGAVTFVSLVTRLMGSSAAVISKVGEDFPQVYLQRLQAEGVDTSGIVKSVTERTTSFELSYSPGYSSRTLRLRQTGSPISLDDLPRRVKAKAIHIAPIDAEIPFEVVRALRSHCKCLSIDPQGLTRKFDEEGNISHQANMDKRILSLVDIYKSSLEEIETITGEKSISKAFAAIHSLGPKKVIVTMGEKGAALSSETAVCWIPAYKPESVIDPTGAGDVFIGAFLAEFLSGEDILRCACIGSAAASLVTEGVGASYLGSKEEILRRAEVIFQAAAPNGCLN